ncbi:MAG: cadmium-translocating P-type ATPase [Bacteroidales bacterium]|nr:cadmium-translocating P-type ATPase [Bacteroidales bacterium]
MSENHHHNTEAESGKRKAESVHCHCHEGHVEHHHHYHDADHCHCNEGHDEHHHHHDAGHGHCHCHEGHCHHDEESPRRQLAVIIISALLLAAAIIIEKTTHLPTWQLLLVYLVPYLVAGWDTLREAAEGIAHGEVFNEHFLMAVATIGALCIGFLPGAETQFPEAVFVMLFFQVGEFFEGYAEGQSRKSISHLLAIRPDTATVVRDGNELTINPDEVAVGETIVVRPGERVPLDAVVVSGTTSLDTAALTGESLPRQAAEGDELLSGCISLNGVVHARVTKPYSQSTVSRIISLVEDAASHKSRSEAFITRFARIYTPVVVFAAIALALLPPLFSPSFSAAFPTWLYRALMFLVVSCPCALVISVPLSFFGGIGGASRKGILIKGANYIDLLSKADTVVFDKTGTLTHGQFAVTAVHPELCDEHHLLHLAAHVEHFSTHPIGAALRDAFPDEATDGCSVTDVEEIAGQGIKARVGDLSVCVGNERMMEAIGAAWHPCDHTGTIIHVAIDGQYAGHIVINDRIKATSAVAIEQLRQLGIRRTVMLTGDSEEVAADVAGQLHIDEHHSRLMPEEKVLWMKRISGEQSRESTAFVGDGINDAPVLAMADVGIAMGGLGSDAAIEAADIVLMDDDPMKVATAIQIARRTLRIARQNVVFAIGVKVAVLLLAAIGIASMWMAVFADVGVTVIAVINAMRTLNVKK